MFNYYNKIFFATTCLISLTNLTSMKLEDLDKEVLRKKIEYHNDYLEKFDESQRLHTALTFVLKNDKQSEYVIIWLQKNIMKYKKYINSESKDNGATPLQMVVCLESLQATRLLLENGADVNYKNAKFDTPIEIAKRANSKEIISILREYGAHEESDCNII